MAPSISFGKWASKIRMMLLLNEEIVGKKTLIFCKYKNRRHRPKWPHTTAFIGEMGDKLVFIK